MNDQTLQTNSSKVSPPKNQIKGKPARSKVLKVIPESDLRRMWTARAQRIFGVFGVIWLLMEPHFAFSPIKIEQPLLAYLLIILASVVIGSVIEISLYQSVKGAKRIINFFVILTQTGGVIRVETFADLSIREFVKLFIEHLNKKLEGYDQQVTTLYDHNLLVLRDRQYQPVDSNLTFREAGIAKDDTCKIAGIIKVVYEHVYLSIAQSKNRNETVVLGESGKLLYSLEGQEGSTAKVYLIDNIDQSESDEAQASLIHVLNALDKVGYREKENLGE